MRKVHNKQVPGHHIQMGVKFNWHVEDQAIRNA
jgi:hypothetical protein